MDDLIQYFDTIENSFKKTNYLWILFACMCLVISLGSVAFSFSYVSRHTDNVYVIDHGAAYTAQVSTGASQRDLECKDHISRFHELMFNLSPSSEAMKRNLDRALVMSDKSAYDYYKDQSEKGLYSRIVSANISQQIVIDSIKVDMNSYPYNERTYGKVYVIRESNVTSYDFVSSGRLVDVGRSSSNPHGLMLEKFQVERQEKQETRRRK